MNFSARSAVISECSLGEMLDCVAFRMGMSSDCSVEMVLSIFLSSGKWSPRFVTDVLLLLTALSW